jgi:hypothetical protein
MSDNPTPSPNAKTTSAIVNAGRFAYVFVNRPNTKSIDVVRFVPNDPTASPVQGKISANQTEIIAKEGPFAAIPYSSGTPATHIALYFFNAKGGISEAKLDNADSQDTNPKTGWRSKDKDITFERQVPAAGRVDGNSFLAGSARNDRPSVVFTVAGNADDVNIAYYDDKGFWQSSVLPVPEDN